MPSHPNHHHESRGPNKSGNFPQQPKLRSPKDNRALTQRHRRNCDTVPDGIPRGHLSWLVSLNAVMPTSHNNSMPQIIFHQDSLINVTVVCVERETIGLGHVSMVCLSNAIHAMPMAINPNFVMRIMKMFHIHRGAKKKGCHLSATCT